MIQATGLNHGLSLLLRNLLLMLQSLISPENGSENNEKDGILIWSKIEDASYYELNVSKRSNFDSLVVEEFFLTDTSFDLYRL
jgi:hypothetical protein